MNAIGSTLFVLLSLPVSFTLTMAVFDAINGCSRIVFKSLKSPPLEAQMYPAGSSQRPQSPDSGEPKPQLWSLALAGNESPLALQAAGAVPACCEYQGRFWLTSSSCQIPLLCLRSIDKDRSLSFRDAPRHGWQRYAS